MCACSYRVSASFIPLTIKTIIYHRTNRNSNDFTNASCVTPLLSLQYAAIRKTHASVHNATLMHDADGIVPSEKAALHERSDYRKGAEQALQL